MTKYALLLILLLAGCASPAPRPETSGYDEQKVEKQDYDNFFYSSWLPKKSTPEN